MSLNIINNVQDLRKELYALLEQEEYACFLEKLAMAIEDDNLEIDADLIYEGAFAYFMLGDYSRATKWVDDALQVDGGNLKARILLGRICILEERTEDALALFEFVLEHDNGQLTEDERDDIATIASYYARKNEEHTQNTYPYLSVLLGLLPPDVIADCKASAAFCMDTEKKKTATIQNDSGLAEQQLTNILQQKISLRDKIKLLETTAGGFYTEGEYTTAENLLAAALTLDPLDDNILRNMAVLQKEMGNREKSLRFAAQMQHIDFLLLRQLR